MTIEDRGFPGGSEVKASAWNVGDLGLIPGSGRSPGEGNGNPLQYSCLENPMDGGAWWATVHRAAKSRKRLSDFTSHGRQSQLNQQEYNSYACTWSRCVESMTQMPPVLLLWVKWVFQHGNKLLMKFYIKWNTVFPYLHGSGVLLKSTAYWKLAKTFYV